MTLGDADLIGADFRQSLPAGNFSQRFSPIVRTLLLTELVSKVIQGFVET